MLQTLPLKPMIYLQSEYIYILLDILVCSIAEYFYELYRILTSTFRLIKIQTTSKKTKQYFTLRGLISHLLSNPSFGAKCHFLEGGKCYEDKEA